MLWRFLSFISPPILAIAVLALVWLAAQNALLRDGKARAEARVILLDAQVSQLEAGRASQNAAIARQEAEGAARRSATQGRLEAFPTIGLPASFDAPLVGLTACDRAEEVRGRLIEALK